MNNDTIVAVSTPPGEAGIGIIRMSGPDAFIIAREIFRLPGDKKVSFPPKSKHLYYGHIVEKKGNIVDEVLISFMKMPNTYTRENIVEVNAHGGSLPLRKIIKICLEKGARMAEPGEFTKRAFLNGRIDLAQAEGILKIIRARSEIGLQAAVNLVKGSLSQKVETIRQKIVHMLAEIEARADFPEEDTAEAENQLMMVNNIKQAITKILDTADLGKIFSEGLATAIIGKPNVGKSSLLNTLAGKERAIVTDLPGTTRDVLEEFINIKGIPLKIIDTAGLRKQGGKIERIGMEKSQEALKNADLILLLFDAANPFSQEDKWIYQMVKAQKKERVIIIFNKIDLGNKSLINSGELLNGSDHVVTLSLLTGEGLTKLMDTIEKTLYKEGIPPLQDVMVSSIRQEIALNEALKAILEAENALENGYPEDVVAIDLYQAKEKLGEITGVTVNEEIMDVIFSQFCLGK